MDKYNSPDYKRSRIAYISQSAIGYFVALLVADAFLASLLDYIGISDAMIGIMTSLASLACVSQFLSIFLSRLKSSNKTLTITFRLISSSIFMFLYVIPFLPINSSLKGIIVFIAVLVAHICSSSVAPLYFKWSNSFINPETRAVFAATNEITSLVGGIIFTTVAGYIVDKYKGLGNLEGAFIFIAVSMLILNILNFISFSFIKKDELPKENQTKNLKDVFKYIIKNKNLRNIVLLGSMWEVANYFTCGFMGIYKISNLGISIFTIQIINIAATVIRVFISRPFGRFSDRYSYAKGLRVGLMIMFLAFLSVVFATKETWYLIIVYTLLYSVGSAGTGQNSSNILFSYVKEEYISEAYAIKFCISGTLGFLASIAGGFLLDIIQKKGVTFFEVAVNAQQILAAITCVNILITIIFSIKVIEKQENLVN